MDHRIRRFTSAAANSSRTSGAALALGSVPTPARRTGQAERRDRGRAVGAHADARSGESLLDLGDLGAPPRLRSAASTSRTTPSSSPRWPSPGGPSTTRPGASRCARASPSTTARPSTPTAWCSRSSGCGTSKLIKSFVYQDIEYVEKDGDYAVMVTTKRPFGSLPAHLTMLGMLPPSAGKAEEAFFQKPVGTGPVPLRELDPRRPGRADGEPEYWKPGIPKVEKVTVPLHPGAVHARRPRCARARST